MAERTQQADGTDIKLITNRRDLQEYVKKKKAKKGKKSRTVLKTACLGCFSPYHQQYNPFLFCHQCHVRFHKLCYTPIDNLCDSCNLKRINPNIKTKVQQCIICPNKGMLYKPTSQNKNIHVFCMLASRLWKFQQNQIKYQQNQQEKQKRQIHDCQICNIPSQYVYKCQSSICNKYSHASCAYLKGWILSFQGEIKIQCCGDFYLSSNQHRRRFILNYKKYTFGHCGF